MEVNLNNISKKQMLAVRRYAILLADELSVSENKLKKLLEEAYKIKDEKVAFNFLSDGLYALMEESVAQTVKVAEDKNDMVLPVFFVASYLKIRESEIKNKINTYSMQFLNEIKHSSKLTSFYKPKINKDTLQLARDAADLPRTAKSSITNIKVLLSSTITDALNKADLFLMSGNGAMGYIGVRQSGFDCPHCDSLCGYFIPITEQVFPAHARCVCGMIPIYKEDLYG